MKQLKGDQKRLLMLITSTLYASMVYVGVAGRARVDCVAMELAAAAALLATRRRIPLQSPQCLLLTRN